MEALARCIHRAHRRLNGGGMLERRDFLITGGTLALALTPQAAKAGPGAVMQTNHTDAFWPGGARLVISISMQMEAGAQPESGAESPLPKMDPLYPDIAATKWYEYGFKEGLPRLLDMFDRRHVNVTSHMVGAAVEKHPALAKEIVQRGHEPSGHGQTWAPQYSMTPEQERKSYANSAATIERVTGVRPVGFNAFWLRGTPHTLQILQELGYTYYIDDVSRDAPFLVNVRSKPFAVVPYTLHMNDIVNYETRYFGTEAYAADLKREFDVLYEEGAHRRRMMSVSAHDRIAGRPARMRVLEEFIQYAQSHPGVSFMRKVDIANYAIASPRTVREDI
jgi:peptidoglycan/xylan/chitin deacetylase (PgdA/CDA1 family)